MDVLEKIFGGAVKIKLMRLFLFNPNVLFDIDTIIARAKISRNSVRRELRTLEDICLVDSRTFVKESEKNGKSDKRKRVQGWMLNGNFSYLEPLQSFLIHTSPLQDKEILRRFQRVGKIRLLIVTGVFIQQWESRVDLLVVGDNIKNAALDNAISNIEAEVGKELSYAVFETKDFNYRLGMYDKLIRDILDYPHKKLINKLGL